MQKEFFGGFLPFSLIDFPGKIAAVIFTKGCAFRCPFCHNPSLVIEDTFSKREKPLWTKEKIFAFLKERKGKLEGVVISGGEPLLHPKVEELLGEIKSLGFATKVDTSGIDPERLERWIKKTLIDYLAMDLKAPLEKYSSIVKVAVNLKKIRKSITLLLSSLLPYEFRTTIVPSLHSKEDIIAMAKEIQGASLYVLQNFSPNNTLDPSFTKLSPFSEKEMEERRLLAAPYVKKCEIR